MVVAVARVRMERRMRDGRGIFARVVEGTGVGIGS
jgi:hypothetical protein